jgi:hypothetical protein
LPAQKDYSQDDRIIHPEKISMRTSLLSCLLGFGLLTGAGAYAQSAASVTATCKDGSSFSGTSRSGACRGHGGVGTWGTAAATATTGTDAAAPPAKTADTAPPATSTSTTSKKTTATRASGGGNGQVWVNSSSKVYHCEGDRYYGKTKSGTYMSESAAKAAGDRPSGGKTCS